MFGIKKLINRIDDLIERLVRVETKIDGLKSSLSVIGVNARDSFARIEESLEDICETANGIILDTDSATAGEACMTTRQACEFLGIGETSLRRLRRSGELPCVKVGNSYLFDVKELEDVKKRLDTGAEEVGEILDSGETEESGE